MAGNHAIEVIDLSELWSVCGGADAPVDKQTQAAQAAIAQATSAVKGFAQSVLPKDAGMTDALLQVLANRRSGSGPGSAPALPPSPGH